MVTIAELDAIKEKLKHQVALRKEAHAGTQIVVCMATCGIAAGARPVLRALSDMVQEKGIEDTSVTQCGCIGLCDLEPIVEVTTAKDGKVTYVKMTPEKAAEVIEKHIIGGEVVKEYTING